MKNYSNTLKSVFNQKTVLLVILCLVSVGCSKPEDEIDLLLLDDQTPNLYALRIDTDLSTDNRISVDSILLIKSILNQNDKLQIPGSDNLLKLTSINSTNASDDGCIDPDYYRSRKMDKKNVLTPITPYLKSLNFSLA